MNMNFDLFEQNGMIEKLESGLLLIKPQINIPKKENIKGGESFKFIII